MCITSQPVSVGIEFKSYEKVTIFFEKLQIQMVNSVTIKANDPRNYLLPVNCNDFDPRV